MCPNPTAGAQQFQAAHAEPQCETANKFQPEGSKLPEPKRAANTPRKKEKALYLVSVVFQPEELQCKVSLIYIL